MVRRIHVALAMLSLALAAFSLGAWVYSYVAPHQLLHISANGSYRWVILCDGRWAVLQCDCPVLVEGPGLYHYRMPHGAPSAVNLDLGDARRFLGVETAEHQGMRSRFFSVPCWIPLVVSALPPLPWFIRHRRRRRTAAPGFPVAAPADH